MDPRAGRAEAARRADCAWYALHLHEQHRARKYNHAKRWFGTFVRRIAFDRLHATRAADADFMVSRTLRRFALAWLTGRDAVP